MENGINPLTMDREKSKKLLNKVAAPDIYSINHHKKYSYVAAIKSEAYIMPFV